MMGIETLQIQRVGMVDDKPFGCWATPVAHVQLRTVSFLSHAPHEDGILLSTQLVR